MFLQPTYDELFTTADATVSTLESLGYNCCFFGGFACLMYGNERIPGDIDVIVLDPNANQEAIKRQLVAKDPRFYLVAAKTPGATYKVLWFRHSMRRSCKVDVLLPGILNIPDVGQDNIVRRSIQHTQTRPVPLGSRYSRTTKTVTHEYPVMPLSVVLLLKLQGWADHRRSSQVHMRNKAPNDVVDINKLLEVATAEGVLVKPAEESFVPKEMLEAAKLRVRTYAHVARMRHTAPLWRALGFDTSRDDSKWGQQSRILDSIFTQV